MSSEPSAAASQDIHFQCTRCGCCCHDLRLPLTLAEAVRWLLDGHEVEILCEAIPWPGTPASGDAPAQHKLRRSFAAASGVLPIRVVAVLAASFAGACPNLLDDGACGIYDHRPGVCGIYPAEINPFIALEPLHKACPPEAWAADRPLLVRAGHLVDAQTIEAIRASRAADEQGVDAKRSICEALGLSDAAMANEGWVAHHPQSAELLAELQRVAAGAPCATCPTTAKAATWRVISNRRATVDALAEIGANCALRSDLEAALSYLPLRPASG